MAFILRSGIDLVEINRFEGKEERLFKRFLERVFTPNELLLCGARSKDLAGRFAVKEAVAKALGTGIGPISWQDIETLRGSQGEPVLCLTGKARELSQRLGLSQWSVSISNTGSLVTACAIAIGEVVQCGGKTINRDDEDPLCQ